jgi:hypothetical protein
VSVRKNSSPTSGFNGKVVPDGMTGLVILEPSTTLGLSISIFDVSISH